ISISIVQAWREFLIFLHGNDLIEPDLHLAGIRIEFDELRSVGGVDIGDPASLSLADTVQVELELDLLLMHRRGLELVVVIARNRFVPFLGHKPLREGLIHVQCRSKWSTTEAQAEGHAEAGIIRSAQMNAASLFALNNIAAWMPLVFAVILLVILVVSFRSRSVVFCQNLEAMTGVKLSTAEVKREFGKRGRNGVRAMFLDLIIREDLKEGPIDIPEAGTEQPQEPSPDRHAAGGI